MPLGYFDIAVTLVMLFFSIRGIFLGFFDQIASLSGIVLGIFVAKSYAKDFAVLFIDYLPSSAAYYLSYILIIFLGMLLVAIISKILEQFVQFTSSGWINRTLGAIVGAGIGLLIASLLAYGAAIFMHDNPSVLSAYTFGPLLDLITSIFDVINPRFKFS